MYDAVESANPATQARIFNGDGWNTKDEETAGVGGGRAGGIWKCFLPQFDMGFLGVKFDASEEELAGTGNQRFGDEATRFERSRFVS